MTKDAGVSPPEARTYVSLRGRKEFDRIYRVGRRRRAGDLVVVTADGDGGEDDPARVAFVAGKRVGNAVRRNRVKRRLRAAAARLPLVPGKAYIVIAGRGVHDARFEDVVGWLAEAMALDPDRRGNDPAQSSEDEA